MIGGGFIHGLLPFGGSKAKMMLGMVTDGGGLDGILMGIGCGIGWKEIGGVGGMPPHPPPKPPP